jgi:predicted PurR-regulated permease PerM
VTTEKPKDHDKIIGHLESEVHTLNTLVGKLFEKNDVLYDKMDTFMKEVRPKPMSFNMVLAAAVSILTVFALLFGSVIYIANSANAPMLTQLQVMNTNIQAISNAATGNTALIQLSNQKMSGVNNKVDSNEATLRWLIFDENIPKQLTETVGRLNSLERRVDEFHK